MVLLPKNHTDNTRVNNKLPKQRVIYLYGYNWIQLDIPTYSHKICVDYYGKVYAYTCWAELSATHSV